MQAELSVLSFVSVVLLLALLALSRVRGDLPYLLITLWLIVSNSIHGVNTFVWAGNTDIHIPAWCDITTKVQLGLVVGLLSACVCLGRRLEMISSKREIVPQDGKRRLELVSSIESGEKKKRIPLLELALCIALPIVFMALHAIVQTHRFDILADYGCSASIQASIPALIIFYILPLFLCFLTLIFVTITAYYALFGPSSSSLVSHLASRSSLTPRSFFCALAVILYITTAFIVTIAFNLFSRPIVPWGSWANVHLEFYEIVIVHDLETAMGIQLNAWIVPVVSVVFVGLVLGAGDEVVDGVKWVKKKFGRGEVEMVLPIHSCNMGKFPDMTTRRSKVIIPPQVHELKSGWDDDLDPAPKRYSLFPKRASRYNPPPSPTPSSSSSTAVGTEDDAFMVSTLTYLGSPVAESLGLNRPHCPPSPPPSGYYSPTSSPPRRSTLPPQRSPSRRMPPPALPCPTTPPPAAPRPFSLAAADDCSSSVISSVFDGQWPTPPLGLPVSPRPVSPRSKRYVPRRASRGSLRGSRDGVGIGPEDIVMLTVVKEVSA